MSLLLSVLQLLCHTEMHHTSIITNVGGTDWGGLSLPMIGHSSGKSPCVKHPVGPRTLLCPKHGSLSIALVQICGPMNCGQGNKSTWFTHDKVKEIVLGLFPRKGLLEYPVFVEKFPFQGLLVL